MGIDNKLNKLKLTKEEIKDALNIQGFSDEEIGNIYSKYPELVRTSGNNDLPLWFKDSIVCWYDVPRQHCTNENMKAMEPAPIGHGTGAKLLDYSGNGLDMDLHGFNWEGMSGIGGYKDSLAPFLRWFDNITFLKRTDTKILFLVIKINENRVGIIKAGTFSNDVKIKVLGMSGGAKIAFWNGDLEFFITNNNIIYYVPKPKNTTDVSFVYLEGKQGDIITIELLPEYPNALVFDGIDDYGFIRNKKLILLDYTIFSKKYIIEQKNGYASVATKREEYKKEGAFSFDSRNKIYNFGLAINKEIAFNPKISYQTKNSYNGLQIQSGKELDTDVLSLGNSSSESISWAPTKMALYQILLFNRTLTQDEIDFVKYEIMGEELPKPVAAWSAKGKTNEDADKNILKDLTGNGHDITLNNFAYAGMSGYGGYGTDFKTASIWFPSVLGIINKTSNIISFNIIKKATDTEQYGFLCPAPYNSFKIKVIKSNKSTLNFWGNVENISIVNSGVYDIKVFKLPLELDILYILLDKNKDIYLNEIITIELLPIYPDGLCFDGVDDYSTPISLNTLGNSNKSFTTIFKAAPNTNFLRYYCYFRNNNHIKERTIRLYDLNNTKGLSYLSTVVFNSDKRKLLLFSGNDKCIILNRNPFNSEENLNFNIVGYNGNELSTLIFYFAYIFDHDLTPYEIRKFTRLNIDREYELPEVKEPIILTYFTLDKSKLDIDNLQ